MADTIDPNYLLHHQYKNATNLQARVDLHERFSTSKVDWHRWIFDHFDFTPDSRILELGCGPAYLWRKNAERIPQDWNITLSDFSAGMLQEAQANLQNSGHSFTLQVINAESIPFKDAHFDYVIANHMLYHVPDRTRAFTEIRRILKPGGRLYATTNGETNLQEIDWLRARIGIATEVSSHVFSLENGEKQLAPWFTYRELRRMEDKLVVTEAEPLLAFVRSITRTTSLDSEKEQQLQQLIEQEIAQHSAFYITKDPGMFIAYN